MSWHCDVLRLSSKLRVELRLSLSKVMKVGNERRCAAKSIQSRTKLWALTVALSANRAVRCSALSKSFRGSICRKPSNLPLQLGYSATTICYRCLLLLLILPFTIFENNPSRITPHLSKSIYRRSFEVPLAACECLKMKEEMVYSLTLPRSVQASFTRSERVFSPSRTQTRGS